jgi:hypothetical protein
MKKFGAQLAKWKRGCGRVLLPKRWREYLEYLDKFEKDRDEFRSLAIHLGYMGHGSYEALVAIAKRCKAAEDKLTASQYCEAEERAAAGLPGLTAAEVERLAVLAEECGEVAQAVGKVLRHGWRSASPFGGPINRVSLESEMGHVRAAIDLMVDAGDVRHGDIAAWRRRKLASLGQWLHHQG